MFSFMQTMSGDTVLMTDKRGNPYDYADESPLGTLPFTAHVEAERCLILAMNTYYLADKSFAMMYLRYAREHARVVQ